ncbi:MAG TPA: hypothetical protein VL443_24150 [Cyclobacteriaceae bacterium]|jgi:hypothetical protein|nr:hypothetical protein [Cyclobacteriaceae bacterium]
MSKVITFSQKFPSYHPRKGESTLFIEKIYAGLADIIPDFKIPNNANDFWDWHEYYSAVPKYHTIRAGHRWKEGDWFSPRIWSGRPYNSKQIILAPDIQLKKVWDFDISGEEGKTYIDGRSLTDRNLYIHEIANNDGLEVIDFKNWFKHPKTFSGQILCWHEKINY